MSIWRFFNSQNHTIQTEFFFDLKAFVVVNMLFLISSITQYQPKLRFCLTVDNMYFDDFCDCGFQEFKYR